LTGRIGENAFQIGIHWQRRVRQQCRRELAQIPEMKTFAPIPARHDKLVLFILYFTAR
jgi:hypothetical protein